MESTLRNPHLVAARTTPKAITIAYWIVTAIFCLEMCFTAYYELLPQGAQAFARLGFASGYFRMELSLAKLVGVAALLVPLVPGRLKEWAYAGFAINLVSAVIAHLSIRDVPQAFIPSTLTSVFWGLSYSCWRRLQAEPKSA
jgi:DoxX-like family